MRDEYAEWRELEARVTAAEAGEGPPLSSEDEARWGALMDAWPLALDQIAATEWLLSGLPSESRPRALMRYLDAIEHLTMEAGVPVPLWIGLARERAGEST